MNLPYSQNVILNIMNQKPNLGKTAIMKIVYMLQQVKKLSLGYDFEIYTYGPYSSEVLDSIDELVDNDLACSKMYRYSNYVGYELNISEKGETEIENLGVKDKSSIDDILEFSDGKSAKDLELYSTIIFVSNLYSQNKLDNGQAVVSEKVHEIKPHFDLEFISNAYKVLEEKKYIKS